MINKNDLMRKLKKNRFLVLVISVIVIAGVYYGVDKAIDSYTFKNNSDVADVAEAKGDGVAVNFKDTEVEGNGHEEKNWFERLFGGEDYEEDESGEGELVEMGKEDNAVSTSNSGAIAEEVDFELEGNEENANLSENKEDGLVMDEGSEEGSEVEENTLKEKIYVYITGEINVPGVVILDKGSRIVDAINAAGGTTVKADVSKVNLVYILEDGMKVNIPNSNDLKNNPNFEYITMSSGDGASDIDTSSNSDGGSSSSNSNSSSTSSSSFASDYSVVNINTATQTELESLPGIGPSLALKIINYRKENGKFSTIEQIKEVSGIGDSKFESLKKYIKI